MSRYAILSATSNQAINCAAWHMFTSLCVSRKCCSNRIEKNPFHFKCRYIVWRVLNTIPYTCRNFYFKLYFYFALLKRNSDLNSYRFEQMSNALLYEQVHMMVKINWMLSTKQPFENQPKNEKPNERRKKKQEESDHALVACSAHKQLSAFDTLKYIVRLC